MSNAKSISKDVGLLLIVSAVTAVMAYRWGELDGRSDAEEAYVSAVRGIFEREAVRETARGPCEPGHLPL
jgi:hypothetical protein